MLVRSGSPPCDLREEQVAEGPQVLLTARWLHARLADRTPDDVRAARELSAYADALRGRRVESVGARGKHLFVSFDGGLVLRNHLRMQGRWRTRPTRETLGASTRIAFDVGATSVRNEGGEVLELATRADAERIRASLGPDVMEEPFPRTAFERALHRSRLAVAESLLDQAVVCGLGNTARCEALFLARVDPTKPAAALTDEEMERLADAVVHVTRECLAQRGIWTHRVYLRAGEPCFACGAPVRRIALAPSRRALDVCARCSGMRAERGLYDGLA